MLLLVVVVAEGTLTGLEFPRLFLGGSCSEELLLLGEESLEGEAVVDLTTLGQFNATCCCCRVLLLSCMLEDKDDEADCFFNFLTSISVLVLDRIQNRSLCIKNIKWFLDV